MILLTAVIAVATSVAGFVAWKNYITNLGVNIRQRDNGDCILGLYLEHFGGLPAKDIVVRIWVNGKQLPAFGWPSMKAGQSIEIGLVNTRGDMTWWDSGTNQDFSALRSLCVEAKYGWWWRPNGYGGRKVLLHVRDGDALFEMMRMFLWKPKSAEVRAIEKAIKDGARDICKAVSAKN